MLRPKEENPNWARALLQVAFPKKTQPSPGIPSGGSPSSSSAWDVDT